MKWPLSALGWLAFLQAGLPEILTAAVLQFAQRLDGAVVQQENGLFAIDGLHGVNQVDDLICRDRRAGRGHADFCAVCAVQKARGLRRAVAIDKRVLLSRADAAGELGSDVASGRGRPPSIECDCR